LPINFLAAALPYCPFARTVLAILYALFFFNDISTIIYAAFRACPMLHFGLPALGAGGNMRRCEFIMRPAFIPP
jgi:hypothetical protein